MQSQTGDPKKASGGTQSGGPGQGMGQKKRVSVSAGLELARLRFHCPVSQVCRSPGPGVCFWLSLCGSARPFFPNLSAYERVCLGLSASDFPSFS